MMAAAEREREIEEKIDSVVDAIREFGVELALAGALVWLGIVLGNEETYVISRFAGCLAAMLAPGAWLGMLSALAATALVAAVCYFARPGLPTGVARVLVLLVTGGALVWIAALALCGRNGTTSMSAGLLWIFAAVALGRAFALCASLAKDGAELDDETEFPEPRTRTPGESDEDGG